MIAFTLGIIIGMAFGLMLMGVLSLGAYDRGFDAATHRRATWLPDAVRHRMGSGEKVGARLIA
jgi:branched-subunit amino acid permease